MYERMVEKSNGKYVLAAQFATHPEQAFAKLYRFEQSEARKAQIEENESCRSYIREFKARTKIPHIAIAQVAGIDRKRFENFMSRNKLMSDSECENVKNVCDVLRNIVM